MPLEEKMNYLNTCTYQNRLSFLLASTCAPVIKNLTCANTLTVKYGSYKHISKQLSNTDLDCMCLYQDYSKEVLMIYRKDELDRHLNTIESKSYLNEFGYYSNNLDDNLNRLADRFKKFYLNNLDFPHELGIFLNYPIEDIKGFILNDGKNSLFTKYWKVYSNLNKAKETFKKFDEAFEIALREIVDGYKISEIIA